MRKTPNGEVPLEEGLAHFEGDSIGLPLNGGLGLVYATPAIPFWIAKNMPKQDTGNIVLISDS